MKSLRRGGHPAQMSIRDSILQFRTGVANLKYHFRRLNKKRTYEMPTNCRTPEHA